MAPTSTISPTTSRVPIFRSTTSRASLAPLAAADVVGRWREHAKGMDESIAKRTLPFWYDNCFKGSRDGYTLGIDARRGRFVEDGQMIVSQARLVWTFARAHRMGYSDADRDYLAAARHGYQHLQRAFLDPEHGGYYWRVRADATNDPVKVLYGNAFVLYALVECSRAAADGDVLKAAVSLFRTLQSSPRDGTPPLAESELASRGFDPNLDSGNKLTGVAARGYRCANTVLHWMEALTELARELPENREVRAALRQSLESNRTKFYPPDLDTGVDYVPADAKTPPWPRPKVVSYGHNVEFAWLMADALDVLGEPIDWPRVEAILAHAITWGYDATRGGLFNAGQPGEKAHDRVKPWWPQAEMIAALAYLIASGRASRSFEPELKKMLAWYEGPQMDPATCTPYCEVSEDGKTITKATLADEWQAAYHDLRARWIFIEALGGER